MSLFYKTKALKQKSLEGQYYAKAYSMGTLDLDDVAELVQANCSAKRSDVYAVMIEMVDVMTEALQNSKTVKIKGLGTFRPCLKCKATDNVNEVHKNITKFNIRFTPELKYNREKNRYESALTTGMKAVELKKYSEGTNNRN